MDSVPGVRKILWRREWHTGKNVQLVGVFVLYSYACQKAPTVEEKKNYTGAGSGGQNDLTRFISFFSQLPLSLSDWAMEYTVGRHQIYANTHYSVDLQGCSSYEFS